MVQTSIIDDAKKLLVAAKDGKIRVGQQFSLAEFAHLTGLTVNATKRLLAVWGTLHETGLLIEGTGIATKGGTIRYAVRVQARTPAENTKHD